MGIFASLLPGVRHLRAPLAAGYLWLVVAWALFYDDRDDVAERGPAFDAVAALREQISDVGLAVAVSFVAYVVGSLSQAATTWMAVSALSVVTRNPPWPMRARQFGPMVLSGRGFLNLMNLVQGATREARAAFEESHATVEDEYKRRRAFDRWLSDNRLRVLTYSDVSTAMMLVREDLPLVHRRLAGAEATRELFAEIDRKQSEAELRLAIWAPLAVTSVVLPVMEWGWRGFLSILVAAPLAFALAYQGVSRLQDANDSIVDSIRKPGELPALELLNDRVERMRQSGVVAARDGRSRAGRTDSASASEPEDSAAVAADTDEATDAAINQTGQ